MSFLTSVCSLNLMRLLLLHIFQRVTVVCLGQGVRTLCLGISSCRLCNKQYEALFSMYLMHQFLIHLWVRRHKFWLVCWVPSHPIKWLLKFLHQYTCCQGGCCSYAWLGYWCLWVILSLTWESGWRLPMSRQCYYYIVIMNNGVYFNENTAWFEIEVSLTYVYQWKK